MSGSQARSTVRRPPVTAKQTTFITNLLAQAGDKGQATLVYHGGESIVDRATGKRRITGLTGGRDGTASRLIDDLLKRNYRTGVATNDSTPATTQPGPHNSVARRLPGPSPAGDRFRAKMERACIVPTGEQQTALAMFATGDDMLLEACAGSGKTATLELLAESAPNKRFQYVAFSRPLVDEAAGRFPRNVSCKTAHQLAYRSHGAPFRPRLDGPRKRSDEVARLLGINPLAVMTTVEGVQVQKRLAAGFLASHVIKALRKFCQSADPEPTVWHFELIDGLDPPANSDTDATGTPVRHTYTNNNTVRAALLPALQAAWADWQDLDGRLPYEHGGYLKAYELSHPKLDEVDVLLVDEAQDLAPVLLSIVEQQTCQTVLVGDSAQAIFGFTGAVDAIAKSKVTNRSTLSKSFRFGQPIADLANPILSALGSDMQVVGNENRESTVGPIVAPVCVLCRTNAAGVRRVLNELADGGRPHLVGGAAQQVIAFARAAIDLQAGRPTSFSELACFGSWAEVLTYCADDPQGGDLKLMVDLIDEFGAQPIIGALEHMPSEEDATIVVGTAHGSKGRQFVTVQLADDFTKQPLDEIDADELRLLYVAVTRAQVRVDVSAVQALAELVPLLAARPPASRPARDMLPTGGGGST